MRSRESSIRWRFWWLSR